MPDLTLCAAPHGRRYCDDCARNPDNWPQLDRMHPRQRYEPPQQDTGTVCCKHVGLIKREVK